MDVQQTIETKKITSCAFTGHRVLSSTFSPIKLINAIDESIAMGCTTFYCGMALGFDLLCAEYVLNRKQAGFNLKLVACVPCADQNKNYDDTDKARYARILKDADETVILSDTYTPWCMQTRNRYMADRADVLIVYCEKNTGGSAYTLKYFQKINPLGKIIPV